MKISTEKIPERQRTAPDIMREYIKRGINDAAPRCPHCESAVSILEAEPEDTFRTTNAVRTIYHAKCDQGHIFRIVSDVEDIEAAIEIAKENGIELTQSQKEAFSIRFRK